MEATGAAAPGRGRPAQRTAAIARAYAARALDGRPPSPSPPASACTSSAGRRHPARRPPRRRQRGRRQHARAGRRAPPGATGAESVAAVRWVGVVPGHRPRVRAARRRWAGVVTGGRRRRPPRVTVGPQHPLRLGRVRAAGPDRVPAGPVRRAAAARPARAAGSRRRRPRAGCRRSSRAGTAIRRLSAVHSSAPSDQRSDSGPVRSPGHPLRRGVLGRADERPALGERRGPADLRDPEVGEHDPVRSPCLQQDVGGLDVAVQDPGRVRGAQRAQQGDARSARPRAASTGPRARDPLGERAAVDQLHDDVRAFVLLDDVVDDDDVRVAQLRRPPAPRAGCGRAAVSGLVVGERLVEGEFLDRDLAAEELSVARHTTPMPPRPSRTSRR